MKERRIFITAVGGDVSCAIIRCIRDAFEDVFLVGCDSNEYALGKLYVDKFYVAPKYSNEEEYCHFLRERCTEENVTYVWPVAEKEILLVSGMAEFFHEMSISVLINKPDVLKISLSKYNTFLFLKSIGIKAPETIRKDEVFDLRFPVIMKPDYGCGGKELRILENMADYKRGREDADDSYVFQEKIGDKDREYTMGIISNGEIVQYIVFRRKLGFGSISVFVETVDNEKFCFIAHKIAHGMKLNGCINVQMREENGEYYVFEINPRISSTAGFRHLLGFTDVVWWIQMLEGRFPEEKYNIPQGIVGMKSLNEVVLKGSYLKTFKEDIGGYQP